MEPVGYLQPLRRSPSGAFSVLTTSVPADDPNTGLTLQPVSKVLGISIRQQVNDPMPFQVHQDGSVAVSPLPGPNHLCPERQGELAPTQVLAGSGAAVYPG